jgi:predicted dienelactone hydrolase
VSRRPPLGAVAGRGWIALLALTSACATIVPPRPPPAGSPSAFLLGPGPYRVEHRTRTFVDRSRPQDERRPDRGPRRLTTSIWFPVAAAGSHPLVLYSHGFLANRGGGTYLAEYLASRGYVVVAPDHPLTRRWGRGGPRLGDVVNQPADLRFLVDQMLSPDGSARPFPGAIDPERIAVLGLSLGGLTTTLTAFHPRLRDPRIVAAVSIAGPMTMFEPAFFATAPVPFLMIAGSADVIIDYASNAPLAVERVSGGQLVAIGGASHAGFDDTTGGVLRLLGNPDRPACWWLTRVLDRDDSAAAVGALARPDDGVRLAGAAPRPCLHPAPHRALDPARQQAITALAVTAFLDSRMAEDPALRRAAADYLATDLARDFPEVRYTAVPPPAGVPRATRGR